MGILPVILVSLLVDHIIAVCPQGSLHHFQCDSGPCIHNSQRCNAENNCADGSDEKECTIATCSGFLCDNRSCVANSDECDGSNDCGDDSDKKGCHDFREKKLFGIIIGASFGLFTLFCILTIVVICAWVSVRQARHTSRPARTTRTNQLCANATASTTAQVSDTTTVDPSNTGPQPSAPLSYSMLQFYPALSEDTSHLLEQQPQHDIEAGLLQQCPTKDDSPGEPCSVVPYPVQQDDSPPPYSASSNFS